MFRRSLAVALLAVILLPLFGGVAFASVCLEPCEGEEEETSCPPVCALCMSCTHAQTAIVGAASAATPLTDARAVMPQAGGSSPAAPAADIFHVPLFG